MGQSGRLEQTFEPAMFFSPVHSKGKRRSCILFTLSYAHNGRMSGRKEGRSQVVPSSLLVPDRKAPKGSRGISMYSEMNLLDPILHVDQLVFIIAVKRF